MGRSHLGEFEELVLLTVGVLYNDAYAVAITKEIASQSGRSVAVSAVHKSLYRLEEKGMLEIKVRLENQLVWKIFINYIVNI